MYASKLEREEPEKKRALCNFQRDVGFNDSGLIGECGSQKIFKNGWNKNLAHEISRECSMANSLQ